MKRFLLGLLRLVLQLLIFALTGTWPRIRPFDAAPAPPAKQPRQRPPKAKKPRAVPRPVRHGHGDGRGASVYEASLSGAGDQASLELLLAGPEGGVVTPRKRTRARPAAPRDGRSTVGAVLRSRAGLRDAIVLDAALGSRRIRR